MTPTGPGTAAAASAPGSMTPITGQGLTAWSAGSPWALAVLQAMTMSLGSWRWSSSPIWSV